MSEIKVLFGPFIWLEKGTISFNELLIIATAPIGQLQCLEMETVRSTPFLIFNNYFLFV